MLTHDLAAADGAGGARAEADDGADGAGAGVGGVDDAEGAEHALGHAAVDGVLARGPGGLGGAAEVRAVVPGGAGVAVDAGRVGDLGGGPVRGEEGLEVGDVGELQVGGAGVDRRASQNAHGRIHACAPGPRGTLRTEHCNTRGVGARGGAARQLPLPRRVGGPARRRQRGRGRARAGAGGRGPGSARARCARTIVLCVAGPRASEFREAIHF